MGRVGLWFDVDFLEPMGSSWDLEEEEDAMARGRRSSSELEMSMTVGLGRLRG